jgi:hypothetical protein
MTLAEKIAVIYPALADVKLSDNGIILQNDSDGRGDYIAFWRHPEYPEPTQEQLDAIQ